jgi:hypothetical protein
MNHQGPSPSLLLRLLPCRALNIAAAMPALAFCQDHAVACHILPSIYKSAAQASVLTHALRRSPMARLMGWIGGPMPFDRHDWFVDRCGEEVRYVIDFYFDDDKAGSPEVSRRHHNL